MESQLTRRLARWALALTLSATGLATGVVTADSAAADIATLSNSGSITIPTTGIATPYPSAITVAGLSGTITDVNVTLNGFTHALPDEVGVVLVAPNGDALLLMDGFGNLAPAGGLNLTFDDSAAAQMPDTGAPTGGSWKPTSHYSNDSFPAPGPLLAYGHPGPALGGTATLASMFNGDLANGTWKLFIRDFAGTAFGSVTGGWSLSLTTSLNTLAVATAGTGTGTVTGTGISCPTDCAEGFPSATSVTLTSTPAPGSVFGGWTGACTGTGSCSVSMSVARSVTATFTRVETTIVTGPKAKTFKKKATFTFSSPLAGASFECSLDGKAFTACASPAKYKRQKLGKHTFAVRATSAGTSDTTPATYTWKVKKKRKKAR